VICQNMVEGSEHSTNFLPPKKKDRLSIAPYRGGHFLSVVKYWRNSERKQHLDQNLDYSRLTT
jgi:hypothetical protein